MRVRDGTVTVRYGRFSWFEWRGKIAGQMIDASAHWRDDRGDIALNTSVPWTIEVRGGVRGSVPTCAAWIWPALRWPGA